jgi:predicted nuclease of predicted toxin-antitoxin system
VILWLDAQLSPKLCAWIRREFEVEAVHVRDPALRDAEDAAIFAKASLAGGSFSGANRRNHRGSHR